MKIDNSLIPVGVLICVLAVTLVLLLIDLTNTNNELKSTIDFQIENIKQLQEENNKLKANRTVIKTTTKTEYRDVPVCLRGELDDFILKSLQNEDNLLDFLEVNYGEILTYKDFEDLKWEIIRYTSDIQFAISDYEESCEGFFR